MFQSRVGFVFHATLRRAKFKYVYVFILVVNSRMFIVLCVFVLCVGILSATGIYFAYKIFFPCPDQHWKTYGHKENFSFSAKINVTEENESGYWYRYIIHNNSNWNLSSPDLIKSLEAGWTLYLTPDTTMNKSGVYWQGLRVMDLENDTLRCVYPEECRGSYGDGPYEGDNVSYNCVFSVGCYG